MSAVLQFDDATHSYTLGGVLLPSVTHILDDVLQEYNGIDPDTLRRAQERGTAVHKACELHDLDDLDYESIDDMLAPYLGAYIRFLGDVPGEIVAIEKRVHSEKYGYAGTLDRIFAPKRKKRRWLIDLKTPTQIRRTVGPQTAAYEQAAREVGLLDQKERIERFALQLRDDGNYRLVPCESPADFSVFLSALTIHKFKRGA